ncbi:MAG: penicillin-binding protein 2, partial [Deltaproteobacteria bacterium]
MTRIPLRPLVQIIEARTRGEDPDAIERANLHTRHEVMRDQAQKSAENRLRFLALFFLCAFAMVAVQMGSVALSEPAEPEGEVAANAIVASRADITDRNGRILATNLSTHALYAQPPIMTDPIGSAKALAAIFPELDEQRLIKDFTGARKFVWLRRKLSPEQVQAVFDIGDPGLLFGPREMRLYPNGRLAAHVLGGATFGREGVDSAEVIGVAGVEKQFDTFLRDPAQEGKPLQLSLDLTVQT